MTVGAAFWSLCGKESALFKTNKQMSIMTMELIAISEVLIHIRSVNAEHFVILTDSKSALQHLARCASGYSRGLPIAFKILKQIYNLNHLNLRLQWVPSHIGLRGNEEADKLAKLAITVGIESPVLPFYPDILYDLKIKCRDKFKEYFDLRSKEKGIWYKTIQCQPPRFPWFHNIKLNRKYIVIAHRLRSGHYPSNKFAFLMKKTISANCDTCGRMDDVQHLLLECSRYSSQRETLVQKYFINRYDVGSFSSILGQPATESFRSVIEMFLHRCSSTAR